MAKFLTFEIKKMQIVSFLSHFWGYTLINHCSELVSSRNHSYCEEEPNIWEPVRLKFTFSFWLKPRPKFFFCLFIIAKKPPFHKNLFSLKFSRGSYFTKMKFNDENTEKKLVQVSVSKIQRNYQKCNTDRILWTM